MRGLHENIQKYSTRVTLIPSNATKPLAKDCLSSAQLTYYEIHTGITLVVCGATQEFNFSRHN